MVERVTLYRAPTTVADADAIADWLRDRVDAAVTVRDRFLSVYAAGDPTDEDDGGDGSDRTGGRNRANDRVRTGERDPADGSDPADEADATDEDGRTTEHDREDGRDRTDELVAAFIHARVLSPYDRETGNEMLGIRRYEERAIENPERAGGVVYDGLAVQRALNGVLPADDRGLDRLHVPLLSRVLGTWGDHDGRWHKRVNVLGQPALVSVPGLYEAPAKPEAYYREKQKHALLSGDAPPREVLEGEVEGDFLVADDPRTTEALKGYVLQAVHYLETGEAFCDDGGCRLSNPHRQAGVVRAQLTDPPFCERHTRLYG